MTNETTASQPKSIGDDTQFQKLLAAIEVNGSHIPEYYTDCEVQLIEFLDSKLRAPAAQASAEVVRNNVPGSPHNVCRTTEHNLRKRIAELEAQASATIQAAPEGWAVEFDKYTLPGTIRLSSPKWGGCFLGKPTSSDTVLSSLMYRYFADLLAATIQEPVMVAEPVAAQFKMPGETWEECSIDEEDAMRARGYKFRYLYTHAAPMVADRAGVPEAFKLAFLKWNGFHTEAEIAAEWAAHGGLCGTFFREGFSATVKAVPKIRITLRQARRLVDFFGGHDADVTVTERPADWEQVEEGLYAFCTEYPEDGAQFLGATETDDELMRLDSVKAVPSEALDADPLDTKLPCDVVIGGMTIRKGVRLGTLVGKAQRDNARLMELLPKPTPEQIAAFNALLPDQDAANFAAPLADKTGGGE